MGETGIHDPVWRFGRAECDVAAARLTLAGDEVEIDRTCLALLAVLLQRAGEPVGKETLLAAGWPGRIVHENSLAKAIGRLRRALGEEGARIEAVYGSGYRLTGEVLSGDGFAPEPGEATSPAWRRFAWPVAHGRVIATAVVLAIGIAGLLAWHMLETDRAAGRKEAEALMSFLSSDLLAPADPYANDHRDGSLRQIVERTAATMDARFAGRPESLLPLHRVVANAFSGWGEYEKAVAHLDKARTLALEKYGDGSREVLPIDISLCQQLRLAGSIRRARTTCQGAVQSARAFDSSLLPKAQVVGAKLHFEVGEYEAAAKSLADALQRGDGLDTAGQADAEWFLGLAQRKLARFSAADAAFRRHLELRQAHYGPEHPLTAWAHADYGDYLVSIGDFAKAERHLAEARRIFDARLGPDHPESLSPAYSRGLSHLWRGEADKARDILRPMLANYRESLGSSHFWTLYTMTELALAEAQAGDQAAAAVLLAEARRTGARVLYGHGEGKAAHFHVRWARTFIAMGKADDAGRELRRATDALDRAGFRPDHPWRAHLHCIAARNALARGHAEAAAESGHACLSALNAIEGLPSTYPLLAEAKTLAAAGVGAAR